MKFEKLKPGMVLYDRHKERAGNTTMRRLGEWRVEIIEVHPETFSATVSWNGGSPSRWWLGRLAKLATWSMYDKDELARRGMERVEGMVGTVAVRKIRAAPGGGKERGT